MVSFTYILSFFFSNESIAQNIVILINFVVGALGSVVILLLRGMDNTYEDAKILGYIFAILPSFCFNFGYDLLLNKLIIFIIDYPEEWMFFTDNEVIKHFDLLLSMIIYLSLEVLIYTVILFIIECNSYHYYIRHNNKLAPEVKEPMKQIILYLFFLYQRLFR